MNKGEVKEDVNDNYFKYVIYKCKEDLYDVDKDPLINFIKLYGEN